VAGPGPAPPATRVMQRKPTRAQWAMIAALAVAFVALVGFAVIEFVGVFNPAGEDTFSEWVFDAPTWIRIAVTAIFLPVGAVAIWAVGHFWEGWGRRRHGDFTDDTTE